MQISRRKAIYRTGSPPDDSNAGAMMSPRIVTDPFIEPSQLSAVPGVWRNDCRDGFSAPEHQDRFPGPGNPVQDRAAGGLELRDLNRLHESIPRSGPPAASCHPAGTRTLLGFRPTSPAAVADYLREDQPRSTLKRDEERTPGDFDRLGSQINPLRAGIRQVELSSYVPARYCLARSSQEHVNARPNEELPRLQGESCGSGYHETRIGPSGPPGARDGSRDSAGGPVRLRPRRNRSAGSRPYGSCPMSASGESRPRVQRRLGHGRPRSVTGRCPAQPADARVLRPARACATGRELSAGSGYRVGPRHSGSAHTSLRSPSFPASREKPAPHTGLPVGVRCLREKRQRIGIRDVKNCPGPGHFTVGPESRQALRGRIPHSPTRNPARVRPPGQRGLRHHDGLSHRAGRRAPGRKPREVRSAAVRSAYGTSSRSPSHRKAGRHPQANATPAYKQKGPAPEGRPLEGAWVVA